MTQVEQIKSKIETLKRNPYYMMGIEDGKELMKQQMINGAVETIIDSKPNDYGEFIPIIHVKLDSSYKDGEKVKIIIIKEE